MVVTAAIALSPGAAAAATAVIAVPVAEVRTAPSKAAPIIATVPAGKEVTVSDADSSGWRVIELGEGRRGWVLDPALRMLPPSPTEVGRGPAPPARVVYMTAAEMERGPTRPPPQPPPAPTAIRLAGRVTGLSQSAWGVEVSQRLVSILGVDATLEAESFGGNHDGVGGEVLARTFFGESQHQLSLGAGPSLRAASEYGAVWFGTFELAYEYRPLSRVSVLVGAGADVVLSDSGTATCEGGSGWFPCGLFWANSYHAGDTHFRGRFAIGGSF
jgi:opacity protein-like surface antigen